MRPLLVLAGNGGDIRHKLLDWPWVSDHFDLIWEDLREHIELTFLAVLIGLLISLPLGILAFRVRALYGPILVTTAVMFTIPSLALFMFLIPLTGLTRTTALIPLVMYTLLILIRNIVTGLDGVPADVRDAAEGMGMSRNSQLVRVELPLAVPAIVAGIRIATVTTIGLVTVTAVVAKGGLGELMFFRGFQLDFYTPVTVGFVLVIVLAITADLILLGAQRLLTPWSAKRFRTAT
jgi:osmoprotectant transport system permease protein